MTSTRLRQTIAATAIALMALTPLLVVVGRNIGRLPLPSFVIFRSAALIVTFVSVVIWIGQRLAGRRLGALPTWAVSILAFLAATWAGIAVQPAFTAPKAAAAAYDAADRLIGRIRDLPRRAAAAPQRDIYLIVLDAMGRPDVLESQFGVDASDSVDALKRHGFTVAARSRSAYPFTFLSLASTLNLSYLDELAASIDPSVPDLYPLQYLIHQNAVFQLARAAGYRVVMLGSDYSTTDSAPQADVCRCRQPIPHQVEHAALSLIPFASALPIDRWAYDAHRAHLRSVFSALRERQGSGPRFVLAHVMAPHPPFVFGTHGPRTPHVRFSFFGPEDEGAYRAEYAEQARFVLGETVRLVDDLLARDGPAPVILIQGDHGPGSRTTKTRPDVDTEFGMFSAALVPDSDIHIADDASPLNTLRVVASRYFGVDLPSLPQHQWHAELMQPYALTRVDPATP